MNLKFKIATTIAIFLACMVSLAQNPKQPSSSQSVVMGQARTGCAYLNPLRGNCGLAWIDPYWGYSVVATWTCNGSVANNYTCDTNWGGCCTILDNEECPPPVCAVTNPVGGTQ